MFARPSEISGLLQSGRLDRNRVNFLIVVADSCRYDTFAEAVTPNLDQLHVVEAQALATFTYPAHMAMFQGFFPHAPGQGRFYDRFNSTLFRWFYQRRRESLIELSDDKTIIDSLRRKNYDTLAVGGVGWFRKFSPMSNGFRLFKYIPDAKRAVSCLKESVSEPFFSLLNFGETHRPYNCETTPLDLRHITGKPSGTNYITTDPDPVLRRKQILTIEYLDTVFAEITAFLSTLRSPTIICFCGDHGDCFGEDGCFGHGFYHPNVMRVPLGWAVFV